jgi:hypothetical protein
MYPAALDFGLHLYSGFFDDIYRNAAANSSSHIPLFLTSTALAVGTGVILFLNLTAVGNAGHLIKTISAVRSRLAGQPPAEKRTPKPINYRLHKILILSAMYGLLISSTLLVLACLAMVTMLSIEVKAQDTLGKKLRILAPHIAQNESLSLDAEWAAMRGRADYLILIHHIDDVASTVGVAFPKMDN